MTGAFVPVARGGRVLIPSAWSVMAHATLEDPSSPVCAQELATGVLEASEASVSDEPTPDLIVEAGS